MKEGGLTYASQLEQKGVKESKEDPKINNIQRFREQCFLIHNINKLYPYNVKNTQEKPYKNIALLGGVIEPIEKNKKTKNRNKGGKEAGPDEPPGNIIAKVIGKKKVEKLIKAKPYELSFLVPQIKLYKVQFDEKGEEVEKELKFSNNSKQSIESIVSGRSTRGDDGGIKSFSYSFAGKDPAEEGLVKCELKLYFQSINALLTGGEEVKYIDLIKRTNLVRNEDRGKEKKTAINHKTKIVVGWADPVDPDGVLSEEFKEAIRYSKIILYLDLLRHTLDFRQDGTLEIKLEYQGAMESVFKDNNSDIFLLGKGLIEETTVSKGESLRAIDENKKEKNKSKEKEEAKQKSQPQDKQIKYSKIIEEIKKREGLYYVDVPADVVEGLGEEEKKDLLKDDKGEEKFSEEELKLLERIFIEKKYGKIKLDPQKIASKNVKIFDKINDVIQKGVKQDKKEESKKIVDEEEKWFASPKEDGKRRIYFFFLGDLLDVAFDVFNLKDKSGNVRKDTKNMRPLLGTMSFKEFPKDANGTIISINPNSAVEYNINIADIPISLNLFITWFLRTTVAEQKERYMLAAFLNDVMSKLVTSAVGEECTILSERQQFSSTLFTVVGNTENPINAGKRTTVQELQKYISDNTVFVGNKSEEKLGLLHHYYFIYVSNIMPTGLSGKEEEDSKKGIYHLNIGSDSGLVKTITFSKTDQFSVGEWRATTDTEESKVLRELYNAKITMLGNNLFSLGQYVYINIGGLSPSPIKIEDAQTKNDPSDKSKNIVDTAFISEALGIGGYYAIIAINFNMSQDSYETELEVMYQGSNTSGVFVKQVRQGFINAAGLLVRRAQKITEPLKMSQSEPTSQEQMSQLTSPFRASGRR